MDFGSVEYISNIYDNAEIDAMGVPKPCFFFCANVCAGNLSACGVNLCGANISVCGANGCLSNLGVCVARACGTAGVSP